MRPALTTSPNGVGVQSPPRWSRQQRRPVAPAPRRPAHRRRLEIGEQPAAPVDVGRLAAPLPREDRIRRRQVAEGPVPLLLRPAARPQPDRRPRVDVRAVDEAVDRVARAPAQREAAQVIGPAHAGHEDHRRRDARRGSRRPGAAPTAATRPCPRPAPAGATARRPGGCRQRRVVRLHRRVRLVEQVEEHRRPVAVARRQDPPQLDRVAVGERGHPVDRPVLADAARRIGVDPLRSSRV